MSDSFRTHDGRTLQQAASDLVSREVLCCMSSMVSTLCSGEVASGRDLSNLCEQAQDLCAPVLDYEEAAVQEGWKVDAGMFVHHNLHTVAETSPLDSDGWEMLCREQGLEAYECEVYEHWAVSTRLAEKLQAAGERVDTDFAGLCVWARTTTGQAISIDAVIERITREMHAA